MKTDWLCQSVFSRLLPNAVMFLQSRGQMIKILTMLKLIIEILIVIFG